MSNEPSDARYGPKLNYLQVIHNNLFQFEEADAEGKLFSVPPISVKEICKVDEETCNVTYIVGNELRACHIKGKYDEIIQAWNCFLQPMYQLNQGWQMTQPPMDQGTPNI